MTIPAGRQFAMLSKFFVFVALIALCTGSSVADECKKIASHWEVSEPLSLVEVEQASLEKMRRNPDAPQVPFGYINEDWNRFKEQFTDGDVLLFVSMDAPPDVPHGYTGYVRMRDGCVQDFLLVSS